MEKLNQFALLIGCLILVQLLLGIFIVNGRAVFNDKKLKRRYHWLHTGLSALLIVPALLFLYYLPEKTALPSAVGMVALIYLLHAVIDFKYVRATREHVVSGIMAAVHAVLALALYLLR
ncbi:hypothetical protein [Saccharibacillus qingshengii]|uniref:hypothetical protein n=1 Tax=Saccharibacillus qingshengii TaxID=1763540 RepID=UPI001555BE58|nr:hypothetical protein [Saccharibacillus qingshengii]